MNKLFAAFAVLLIMSGLLLLAIPREAAQTTRSAGGTSQAMGLILRARELADQANAPLSILFGLASLYYSRKRYLVERDGHGGKST